MQKKIVYTLYALGVLLIFSALEFKFAMAAFIVFGVPVGFAIYLSDAFTSMSEMAYHGRQTANTPRVRFDLVDGHYTSMNKGGTVEVGPEQ